LIFTFASGDWGEELDQTLGLAGSRWGLLDLFSHK